MTILEEKIFEDRKVARELYYQVVLENKTTILYNLIEQKNFENIIRRRDLNIKNETYPNTLEYKREYKGYKVDVTSCFGFNHYMVNILKPENLWRENNKFIIGELHPVGFPAIYNRPFGMEYYDLIRVQEYIKFNLTELEKLDCADFEIEKNNNWPCYFFNKKTGQLICMSKEIEDKNVKLEGVKKFN